jgi:WD40 repeat protein
VATQALDASLWDAQTGALIAVLKAQEDQDQIAYAGFSPDGTRLSTVKANGNWVHVWDIERSGPRTILSGHSAQVRTAVFSPDGGLILTASGDKTARLWDGVSGQPVGKPLQAHEDSVWDAEFSPNGSRIVTASRDKTVRQWDARTRENGLKVLF